MRIQLMEPMRNLPISLFVAFIVMLLVVGCKSQPNPVISNWYESDASKVEQIYYGVKYKKSRFPCSDSLRFNDDNSFIYKTGGGNSIFGVWNQQHDTLFVTPKKSDSDLPWFPKYFTLGSNKVFSRVFYNGKNVVRIMRTKSPSTKATTVTID